MLDTDRTAIFDVVDRTNVGENTYTEITGLNLAQDTDYWTSVIGQLLFLLLIALIKYAELLPLHNYLLESLVLHDEMMRTLLCALSNFF